MEKSGRIQLTLDELRQYNNGSVVPQRVLQQWGITEQEFREILDSGQYEVLDSN